MPLSKHLGIALPTIPLVFLYAYKKWSDAKRVREAKETAAKEALRAAQRKARLSELAMTTARAESEEAERLRRQSRDLHRKDAEAEIARQRREARRVSEAELEAHKKEAQSVIAELMNVAEAAQLDAEAARKEAERVRNESSKVLEAAEQSEAAAAAGAKAAVDGSQPSLNPSSLSPVVAAAAATAQPSFRSSARVPDDVVNGANDVGGFGGILEGVSRERRKSIDMKNQLRMERQGSMGGGTGMGQRMSRDSVGSAGSGVGGGGGGGGCSGR